MRLGFILTARAADLIEKDLLWAWVDNAHVGLCVTDGVGTILIVNRVFTELCGVTAASMIQRDLSVAFASLEAPPDLIDWAMQLSASGSRELVAPAKAAARYLSINASTVSYRDGSQYRILAITDVSDLRAAQMELERSARQWDAINAGVVIADARKPDMPIVYVNPTFERMTGYSASEVIGRNCRFLQGGETSQPGISLLRDAIREKTNGYALLRNFRKDGSLFMNELFISPVRDKSGEVTHFIGVQHVRHLR